MNWWLIAVFAVMVLGIVGGYIAFSYYEAYRRRQNLRRDGEDRERKRELDIKE